MKNSLKLLLVVFIFVGFGCNKKEDEAPKPIDKSSLLIGDWEYVGFTVDPALKLYGVVRTDLWPEVDNCIRDNIYMFKSDKTYVWDEGETKCAPFFSQTNRSGEWMLLNNSTKIVLTDDLDIYADQTLDVEVLNSTEFKFSWVEEFYPGEFYTFTDHYQKIK